MGKILVFVSIVFTLLSAGLGFVNKGKLSEAKDTATAAEATAASAKSDLTKTKGELKTTTDTLAALTSEKAALDSQVTSLKSEADTAKAAATKAETEKAELQAKVTQGETDLAAAKTELDQIKANPTAANAAAGPDDETKAIIAEKETLIAKLQSDLDSSHSQLEVLQKANTDRQAKQIKKGLEGRILAVNPAWNFVVLNLGDKNGVVSNAELLVKRGTQLVGKVRITSVEPSTSIADIVANSVPQGTTISPGDNVIYQNVGEE
jgi:cell shape-determining protein MreC